jgi:Protein of unknown function (DUF551)
MKQNTHGGPRPGSGRKPSGTRPVQIRLTEPEIAKARTIGEGSITAGVRRALHERMEWKPIETGPKDGSEVLVYGRGNYTVAYWDRGEWRDVGEIGWAGMYGDGNQPTHWMPLPKAPNTRT